MATRARNLPNPLSLVRTWALDPRLKRVWIPAATLATALFVAFQIVEPNIRLIQVLLASALLLVAMRVPLFYSFLFVVVMIPLRKATTYGGTTLALILVLFLIWTIRMGLRTERGVGRSSIDWPVIALGVCYLSSFFQIKDAVALRPAFFNSFMALSYIGLAYLAIHFTRTEAQLRALVAGVIAMATFIHLTALFELAFPGRPFIPGWLGYVNPVQEQYVKEGLEIANMRVGGAIYDYELLAEFCAMMMILFWFLVLRARSFWQRVGSGTLLFINTFVLLATATRGALVSLAVAALYLMWRLRKRLRLHTVVIGTVAALAAGNLIVQLLVKQTRAGNIIERLSKTEFVGVVPETRVGAWKESWERILQSPVFGHGPYYSATEKGVSHLFVWPHNNYFFYWFMLGGVGLAAFLWILLRLWLDTRLADADFRAPSYPGALLLALEGMLIVFAVDQIKIDYLRNDVYSYWVWLFIGMLVATARIKRAETRAPEPPLAVAALPAPRVRPARVSTLPSV